MIHCIVSDWTKVMCDTKTIMRRLHTLSLYHPPMTDCVIQQLSLHHPPTYYILRIFSDFNFRCFIFRHTLVDGVYLGISSRVIYILALD